MPRLPALWLCSSLFLVAFPNSGSADDGTNPDIEVTIHEGIEKRNEWPESSPPKLYGYRIPALLIAEIPVAYMKDGIRRDYRESVLLRAKTALVIESGTVSSQWMVRAGGLSRLMVDGKVIADTDALPKQTNGHNPVQHHPTESPFMRRPHPGHHEKIVELDLDEGEHTVTLETLIGDDGLRHAPGEVTVAMRLSKHDPWQVLGSEPRLPLNDQDCEDYLRQQRHFMQSVNDRHRRRAAKPFDQAWNRRHALASKAWEAVHPSQTEHSDSDTHPVDRFLVAKQQGTDGLPSGRPSEQVAPRLSDNEFARRLYLQTLGVLPSEQELAEFRAQQGTAMERRTWLTQRVLDDDRWADHWAPYWMDVLAENPNILKPTLNNTGPFRWYLYEAMRDNVAVDRWVTNLIRMEGSTFGGGPAGFAMASQNDVPMAAKAHVLGTAFLAVNMKCARCHDAPYHDWTQEDLFSLAAMLNNGPIKVPASSSVPDSFFEGENEDPSESLITRSLSPGDQVSPRWSLEESIPSGTSQTFEENDEDLPREELAQRITGHQNPRFARVFVNRIWHRLMGEAIVEPIDDWETSTPSHPELLNYLAGEFVRSGYDTKSIVRLITTSDVYSRRSEDREIEFNANKRQFPSPRQQRMTAEQVVDSMHHAMGRPMDSERLSFDAENTRRAKDFGDLGQPRRAWQLTSLSNERDRPSLTFPRASAICECLEAFGWKGSRQEPIHHRDDAANVVQPAVLASGTLSIQLTRLTDGDELTERCVSARTVDELVDGLFQRFLTRPPNEAERHAFTELLSDGFDQRIVLGQTVEETPIREAFVHWGNHLSMEANEIRQRENERLRHGPSPTQRLQPEWREKVEDAVWALLNSPEFQFLP